MKELDFTGKPCPIPVIESKKLILESALNDEIKITVDNDAACENIKRLLANLGQNYELNGYKFSLKKSTILESNTQETADAECVLFKSAKIGDGELGGMLAVGFLTALAQRPELKKVILINDAIFMACDSEHPAHLALANLASKGVEIICCANCLNYFAQSPKIGVAGDAMSIIDALFSHKTLSL